MGCEAARGLCRTTALQGRHHPGSHPRCCLHATAGFWGQTGGDVRAKCRCGGCRSCPGRGAAGLPVLVVPTLVYWRGGLRSLSGGLGPALPTAPPGLPKVAVVAVLIVRRGARAPHIPAVRAPLLGRGVCARPAVAARGPVALDRVSTPKGLPEALVHGTVLGVVPTAVLVALALQGSWEDRGRLNNGLSHQAVPWHPPPDCGGPTQIPTPKGPGRCVCSAFVQLHLGA